MLGAALDRLDGATQDKDESESTGTATNTSALQRLHELMVAHSDFEETIDRLLSLGCEHFGLDTGILANVEGPEYEVEAVVDATDTHEVGAVYEFEETMCAMTLASDATDPIAFRDSAETEYSTHPASDTVRAYIAAPVVVDGETYGTVNFSSENPRETEFREGEIEFIKLLAQWIGSEIGRRERVAELERYETILEAIGDPVYALDTDARFTFVNDAAKRQFGYGEEILGKHVSIGMKEEDIERVAKQRRELAETDKRSMTAQFELETADGSTRLVENRLALIGETSHRGSAGVLRDVTEREQRRQKLESFQQAIENAADGVAILDGDEYVYVDQTHVDIYGFESADQLLGNSWRMLYDDDEVERLETEVFPTLEADGHWRGKVTGSRPNGTTFPAELSLTIIEDGRLVCTVRDESERMERKRELELKERAMDEADVSIQITDPTQDGNPLVYVNEGFERETGYDKADALGRNPRFLQGPETDPAKVDKLRAAIDNEQPVTVELKNHRADGSMYWAKLSITPVYDDCGSVTNFIGIQQDVTERRELVERLEKRTERLDLVLEKTGTGIVEWDLQTDELTWDETMVEVLGREPETVDEFFELVHPDDRADIEADLERLLETGEPFRGECRIRNGDGEVTWIETQNVLISEDGDSARVVAMGADITERKKREEAIIESEQRYQTLLRAAPDPVIIADAETGEIVETNAAAAELRGESQEEIVGRHQSELHPSADAEAYRAAFENAIGGRTMVSELPDGSQVELCTADGEAVPVEINADTVELPQGPMIYGVFRDISDRVEKEQELELKERAMDEANLGITISDPSKPDNPLIYVNDGFLDQTGYSRTEAIGRNCRFLQGDDRDQAALDTLRDAIGDEEPVTVELRNYRKDGEQFWNRLSVTPIYDDAGELVNYIGIQQDVTEGKTKARQLRTLHDTTRELLQAEDLEAAATVAVKKMAAELGVNFGGLYKRAGDELVRVITRGPAADAIPDRIERGQTPMWEAIETGESVVYEDLTAVNDGIDRGNATAGTYIPLGDHGVLAAGVSDATTLDSTAQQLIEVLAGNLVAVLDTIKRARELTRERERFQLLTESVDEYAFLTIDDNGDIETWNEGAKTLFGYDAETAIGMSVTELHRSSDRESETTDRLLQQARIAGESADEGWRVRADGSEFFADVRYAKLETDDGESRGYAKIVRDMTERRRQRRRTELFVEESDDVVAILDTDGSMSYVSGSAERVLGYDPDELIGENLFDYIHADRREAAMEEFYDGLEDESSRAQMECRFRSGDGEWLNVDGRWRNMRDTDAIDGMLLYLRDVTEIKERARQFGASSTKPTSSPACSKPMER